MPNAAARVLVMTVALSVLLIALLASSEEPICVNEIVTVVATVIGVDTVMPSVEFMAAEMALIKLAVRAVAFAPVLRLSSPVGVKVMTKVSR